MVERKYADHTDQRGKAVFCPPGRGSGYYSGVRVWDSRGVALAFRRIFLRRSALRWMQSATRTWRPDRLVLITPIIGITPFAQIAGFAALPTILPAFAKAAWFSVMPELNSVHSCRVFFQKAHKKYRTTIITHTDAGTSEVSERVRGWRAKRDYPPLGAFFSAGSSIRSRTSPCRFR